MRLHTLSLVILFGASTSLACGSSQMDPQGPQDSETETSDPLTAAPSAEPAPAAVEVPDAWSEDLSMEQQIAFMKEKVVPAMGPLFQAHDSAGYGDFGCATCHGPDNKEPKDYLPELTFKDGQLTSFADEPEMSLFMAEKVTPAMAGVFGMEPYDPKTQTGFGCAGCHSIAMK